ncbi:MAG: ABC transporter permease [Flammeovirgaceae bacterium]
MQERTLETFFIALDAILANKVRSVLTALGIIFGVAAVIAMLAIGKGAEQQILENMKMVGVNNIVVKPIIEQVEEEVDEDAANTQKNKFSPGLTLLDVANITKTLPTIERISPEIELETYIVKKGIRRSAKLIGVEPAYFEMYNLKLAEGKMFNQNQSEYGKQVCIIGKGIATRFFTGENPIGKQIKCGAHWLTIIGVIEERQAYQKSMEKLGIRNVNMDVYTPLKTMLIRYENRALVTSAMVKQAARENNRRNDNQPKPLENYHQLDRVVVQVKETPFLNPTAETISRMLERRHYELIDYEIEIPELMLKQKQQTQKTFNVVLFAIAFISLIVGGIGIMNIMLASVLERIKEIGLRLALGAKKMDITLQFLFESVIISLTGGILGIILGVVLAFFISEVAEMPTIISIYSILISFAVATSVGLIFGITPAQRAASQDPITSLRYE